MAEVGRDLWMSPSPAPLPKQDQLEQVAQDCVQSSSEYLQGWRLHNSSGQTVPVFDHPQNKEVFCCI